MIRTEIAPIGRDDADFANGAVGHAAGKPGRQQDRVAEKLGNHAVLGVKIELAGRSDLRTAALAHHGNLVGEGQRLGLIVRDQDGRDAGRVEERGHRLAHALAQAGVERRERLVEQHQPGLPRQRPGQCHPLLLAAGQLVRPARAHASVELDHVQQLGDAPRPFRLVARSGRSRYCRRRSRCGNSAPSCITKPMPRRWAGTAAALGQRQPVQRTIVPASGVSNPAIRRKSVVLPEPDGPTIAVRLPAGDAQLDAVQRHHRAIALADAASSRKLIDRPARLDWRKSSQVSGSDEQHHEHRIGRGGRVVELAGQATRIPSPACAVPFGASIWVAVSSLVCRARRGSCRRRPPAPPAARWSPTAAAPVSCRAPGRGLLEFRPAPGRGSPSDR